MDFKKLFSDLYLAPTEDVVDNILFSDPFFSNSSNWSPLGGNESNFGIIENQQSSPVAAIIEKITNSIDAILMRKCYEAGIEPKSPAAPRSMDEAVKLFFKQEHINWHLSAFRQKQADEIQILADGPRLTPSLSIYDNGEGQHPADFEGTFLSLVKGNKNEIPFVQGKYNMGGTGAIVFCGKKRYQLIGSRKHDKSGNFGFTLVRKHPMDEKESITKKNTWYEYFKPNNQIPEFPIEKLDIGLRGRQFSTGTIIKMYSYDLPEGARSVISRDLNQSINEFLFEPALPVLTVDKPERYPKDINLARDLFGLKRRLEEEDSKYVEDFFSESIEEKGVGKARITCYVFKPKLDGKTVKESRESIEREFFKNNMSILFSLNGQVHGNYTSEFITRSLKMPLLKSYLLVDVDCTHMSLDYRNELFMASRDRLKDSDETRALRSSLTNVLTKGKLQEIYKRRKDSISLESSEGEELIKSFTKSLPFNDDLLKLLNSTFKLEGHKQKETKKREKKESTTETETPFNPKRFPTFFKLRDGDGSEARPAAKLPLSGQRSIKLETDVENQFFDRSTEPGELRISLLSFKSNNVSGGTSQGTPKQLSDLLNIAHSSPDKGTIRIVLNPTKEVQVGDLVQIKAVLAGPDAEHEACFWVKIVEEEHPSEKPKKQDEDNRESLGLPKFLLLYQEKHDDKSSTWENVAAAGIDMGYDKVVYPLVTGDKLECIYINMDSHVLKTYKSRRKTINAEQLQIADKRYISSVYFHTLFLFIIAKNQQYKLSRNDKDADLTDFLKDIFNSHYAEFLLNFGTDSLMESLNL